MEKIRLESKVMEHIMVTSYSEQDLQSQLSQQGYKLKKVEKEKPNLPVENL